MRQEGKRKKHGLAKKFQWELSAFMAPSGE